MTTPDRVTLQPAYLLHHRPYRESSRILDLLTPDFGRVALVARGSRRPATRWTAALQPFRELQVSWVARGELGTLTGCESGEGATSLASSLIYSAYYMNELILRLVERQDPHPQLYVSYSQALREMQEGQQASRVLRLFEKRLLESLGYGLNLTYDIVNKTPVREHVEYHYRLEQGPAAATTGSSGDMIFSGASLLSLARDELDDPRSLKDGRRLLHRALQLYLGDRPLNSRRVFRAVYR